MDEILDKMKTMSFREPAQESVLKSFQNQFHFILPADYTGFMLLHNGAEGPIGEYAYLAVWSTNEIADFYNEDSFKDVLSGFFFFASDRSGEYFAFDYHSPELKIVSVPDDLEEVSEITVIADSFDEFISYIFNLDFSEDMEQIKEGELH